MLASDFDYPLPEGLIAQRPLEQRDHCRLCVVRRAEGGVEHRVFSELPGLLKAGDLLVLNNSRVVRARLPCLKDPHGGAVEVFLLEPPGAVGERRFKVFFKPARKAQPGTMLRPQRDPASGAFEVIEQGGEMPGVVEWRGPEPLNAAALERLGVMPLPPYIKRARLPGGGEAASDANYYQNVFAREDGSAAAPTAGLHFTPELIGALKAQGVLFSEVTLHVGAGTFLPVKSADMEGHRMHSERYEIGADTIASVQDAKREGRRVIPVGTTALRVLESAFNDKGEAQAGNFETAIFIMPGYRFKIADALITNFHQPKSTLLALISAFYEREKILEIYRDCASRNYRFLSYGDAMLLI
jgi:S-adenosylmethionine:tRNA ribosyltransferase-isomerase